MFEIYTKEQCIYCAMAKELFKLRGVEYLERKLHEDFDRDQIKAMFPTQSTYPYIVLDNKLIGGYTDLLEHYKKETA